MNRVSFWTPVCFGNQPTTLPEKALEFVDAFFPGFRSAALVLPGNKNLVKLKYNSSPGLIIIHLIATPIIIGGYLAAFSIWNRSNELSKWSRYSVKAVFLVIVVVFITKIVLRTIYRFNIEIPNFFDDIQKGHSCFARNVYDEACKFVIDHEPIPYGPLYVNLHGWGNPEDHNRFSSIRGTKKEIATLTCKELREKTEKDGAAIEEKQKFIIWIEKEMKNELVRKISENSHKIIEIKDQDTNMPVDVWTPMPADVGAHILSYVDTRERRMPISKRWRQSAIKAEILNLTPAEYFFTDPPESLHKALDEIKSASDEIKRNLPKNPTLTQAVAAVLQFRRVIANKLKNSLGNEFYEKEKKNKSSLDDLTNECDKNFINELQKLDFKIIQKDPLFNESVGKALENMNQGMTSINHLSDPRYGYLRKKIIKEVLKKLNIETIKTFDKLYKTSIEAILKNTSDKLISHHTRRLEDICHGKYHSFLLNLMSTLNFIKDSNKLRDRFDFGARTILKTNHHMHGGATKGLLYAYLESGLMNDIETFAEGIYGFRDWVYLLIARKYIMLGENDQAKRILDKVKL